MRSPRSPVWREAASFADLEVDGIGSSIATIGDAEAGPLLAVVGHIDEIGIAVTHVDDKGFVYFTADRRLGPADPRRPARSPRDPRRARCSA